MINNIP